ncbi:hypothetical protein pb186bvf_003904 [Paramecium bursaria]
MKQLLDLNSPIQIKKQDYQIIKELGDGSFGKVYLIAMNNQNYALKTIKIQNLLKWQKVEQAKLELSIMYSLNHENIIKLHGHFEDEDYIYLLLDYIGGGDLFNLLKRQGTLSENQVIHYIRQVVEAFIYLHSLPKPVIHRDIKPENILVDENNKVKLADFGSANSIQTIDGKRQTYTGTQPYMSPEMLDGNEYDQRLDIWSIGVLIYELLTNKSPFTGDSIQQMDEQKKKLLIQNIKQAQIIFPVDFPPLAKDLVRKILKKEPSQRISLRDIRDHPWINKNIHIDIMKQEYLSIQQRVDKAVNTFKMKPRNKNQSISEYKEKILLLKQQINTTQVELLKSQMENKILNEKLQEIQQAGLEQDETQTIVSPSQIASIEEKFNGLQQKIIRLHKQIHENNTIIARDHYKLSKLETLQNKVIKEKQNVEKMERLVFELNKQKVEEQAKQDEIYKKFASLNQLEEAEEVEEENTQLREAVDKLKIVVQQHKHAIFNQGGVDQSILTQPDDNETEYDNQIDEKTNQLQKQYDEKKKLYQEDLSREKQIIQNLLDEQKSLKSQLKQVQDKEKQIKHYEQQIKNLDFFYKIKLDKVKELKQQIEIKEKEIKNLTLTFEDEKQKSQVKIP